MVQAILVQYKFILPSDIKHSSYTYQKLFRALYGYTQNVSKSSGKTYRYHRPGVLSSFPFTKPGKNLVLIPKSALSALVDFFKTGKTPSHEWHVKGDWKAAYYTDERDISVSDAAQALDAAAARVMASLKSLGEQASTLEPTGNYKGLSPGASAAFARLAACEWVKECAHTPQAQKITALSVRALP